MNRTDRILLAVAVFLLVLAFAQAQTPIPAPLPATMPAPPDVTASQTAAGIALVSYKSWSEARLVDLWKAEVASQDRLRKAEARLAALEEQVTALRGKVTTAGTTLAKP